jgi:hypothetical protein
MKLYVLVAEGWNLCILGAVYIYCMEPLYPESGVLEPLCSGGGVLEPLYSWCSIDWNPYVLRAGYCNLYVLVAVCLSILVQYTVTPIY